MSTQFLRVLAAVIGLSTVSVGRGGVQAASAERFSARQVHMGVEFTVILYASDRELAQKATAAAFERIDAIDKALSDYRPDSETNRLCAQAPTAAPVEVSDDLFRVLQAALNLSKASGGAFDPTIGPLTKVWRRARRQKQLPPAEDLAEARAAVGWRNVVLHDRPPAVELRRAGMRLDFGGIAKGYAVDEGLAAIQKMGIAQALVQASGDIAVGDPPPGQPGWKTGLAPLNPDDPPARFVWLKNQAISTSGDARQHLIVNGRRYSHILDPRSGEPISGRSSVSVIAPSGLLADGLATAIDVLGPRDGLQLLKNYDQAAALMITDEHRELRISTSPNWEKVAKAAEAN